MLADINDSICAISFNPHAQIVRGFTQIMHLKTHSQITLGLLNEFALSNQKNIVNVNSQQQMKQPSTDRHHLNGCKQIGVILCGLPGDELVDVVQVVLERVDVVQLGDVGFLCLVDGMAWSKF
jgi:hypothetical protein